ncbi:MAG: hypothetical protein COV29_04510 [Candidatus Yanofskybacteria bacterium CG10_big_fil_rev_8_21_14_0_10_36_16]|uniref:Uncharacterized protein n=1 Tax=Candidatus Yanofskybacteria bacterium CG10_big_fil_rev_8_21_14_0_10_36_16 TaxID=1975096 RepID=A0A2J0Q6G9_9BACT|nr:MAG: hypothetical protein COV29_04510 [Candidatus Yanofskybacteria bacterium CG10_big_fil_rev_8_21_14_0_10_36_16]
MTDNYYYQITAQRGLEKEYNQITNAANQVIQPPSSGRYAALYFLAIVGDIVDFFPGVSFFVDLILFIPFAMLGHSASKKTDAMHEFTGNLVSKVEQIENTILALRRNYALVLKTARKFRPLRKVAAKISKSLKFGKRSKVFMKIFGSAIIDLVPYLGIIPFRTLSVYSSKKEEKEAYELAVNEILPAYAVAAQERAVEIQELNEIMATEAIAE